MTEAEDFAGIGDFPRALTARFPPLASDALTPNLSACVVAYSLANGSWWRETWSLAASGAGATGEVQVRVEARGDVDVAYCPRKLVLDLFRSAARPEEEEQQGEELLRVRLGDVHASALKGEDAGVVCAAAPAAGMRVLGGGRGVRGGLSVDGRVCGWDQIWGVARRAAKGGRRGGRASWEGVWRLRCAAVWKWALCARMQTPVLPGLRCVLCVSNLAAHAMYRVVTIRVLPVLRLMGRVRP